MASTTASRAAAAEELRAAMLAFFAAQRRLRGRDTKRGGLTEAGRDVVAATQGEMDARWRDALADLSARQLADGAQVLRRMAAVLDEL